VAFLLLRPDVTHSGTVFQEEKTAMRYAQVTTIVALAAALTASACNRPEPAEEVRDEAADARQRQQDEAAQLETRIADLDREWSEMQAKIASKTGQATTALKAEVQEDLANVREAVADLRTTNAENWWERHERTLERTAEDVEQDVRRFARRWTEPELDVEGTVGTAETWEARRERFVRRMEARIESMETALKDIDLKGAQETEVEDTRARVRKMREDTDRLRNASENDWWEITKARVSEYIDRVDRSIDRLDDDQG
jgi:hypothetical protein